MSVSPFKGSFALWNLNYFNSEKKLSDKLQENKFFPFQVQQPKVFVMEYYKDMVWKGALLFVISLVGTVFYFRTEKVGLAPPGKPSPLPCNPLPQDSIAVNHSR
nr:PREDICTED: transmembrane protein 249 [Anolis carolinensis]|eukprot:XP_016854768.1 PREDICTED: transmembrane protein 249 [Anolis carolinensis]